MRRDPDAIVGSRTSITEAQPKERGTIECLAVHFTQSRMISGRST
jgi:hypothetical protein